MSNRIHSYNQFHAAGHGTFFSGRLRIEEHSSNQVGEFLWVYDCGSARPGRMSALVQDLHDYPMPHSHRATDRINLLCLSHFDQDHVNGLKILLQRFSIDVLALPYLPFERRLALASSFDIEDSASADTVLFTLDPIGYLVLSGLRNRIKRIILVKGGETPASAMDAPLQNSDFLPSDQAREDGGLPNLPLTLSVAQARQDENYGPIVNRTSTDGIETLDHSHAGLVGDRISGLWEFVFFNKDLPSGIAPKSGLSLSDIQREVAEIVDKYDLSARKPNLVEGWKKELRICYEKNFGKTSVARNDISLCLLSRPMFARKVSQCKLFDPPCSSLGSCNCLIPAPSTSQTGLLLTGDISLDNTTLNALKRHLHDSRWNSIWVMQIPHHGSQHSWHAPLAHLCPHEYSVLCVPDTDSRGNHPHFNVLSDLNSAHKKLFRADYNSSVVYRIHADN